MSERVQELERLVRYHQERYYNDEAEISDQEFDALWDELRRLDPENALFSEVGTDRSEGFPKREHIIPMGSQEKAADPEAFRKWINKIAAPRYVVQYKLDGASMELQYENGRFRAGVTRGDGRVGDDITRNVRRMRGVIEEVGDGFTGAVRGEVMMEHEVHEKYYSEKANCRNAANGVMKRKDGVGSDLLRVMVYDAMHREREDFFSDEVSKLAWLEENGFDVVTYKVFEDPEDIIAYREEIAEARGGLPFDIDGLVVKSPDIDREDMQRARPEKQIAFKFALEQTVTQVREVEWSTTGNTYTPVAKVEPVRLAGTTVQRASLVHPEHLEELGIRIGSEVVITKRGEIIPKIEKVVHNPANARAVEVPRNCVACGTELINEGKRLYCPNFACPLRLKHRLRKWVSVLDIKEFGPVLIDRLFDSGKVRYVADLYRVTPEEIAAFEGMGEGIARKALGNLRAASEIRLPRFVAGFDIGGIGELIVEKLVSAGYDTLEKLREASVDDLAEVEGIGTITAETLKKGLDELRDHMDALLETGAVRILAPPRETPISGKSFCFSGSLSSMKRSEAEETVRSLGGSAKSAVTTDLDFLVTNDPESGSSKNRKARELGVRIISEEEFLRLVALASSGSTTYD
ncbi:MAG: NAD-dependent DNA ligase LigA [Spirochaetaceae bacterium]